LSSHAGEVAWPGGKADPGDASLVDTVFRETQEEIGLQAQDVELVGRLASFVSKYGLWVTPFVGLVHPETSLLANPDEIENIFEVPLKFLLNDPRVATEQLDRHNEVQFAPVYEYENFRIWGLTALILEDFMKFGMGIGIR
jgi:8-oxo-dGTP pyrophosphatase MutT (NUDIX family)